MKITSPGLQFDLKAGCRSGHGAGDSASENSGGGMLPVRYKPANDW
jgi:hypothetical protein